MQWHQEESALVIVGLLDLNMKGRRRQYKESYELPLLFLRKEENFCIFLLN